MSSVLGRSRRRHVVTDSGKAVKYTPCSNRGDHTDEEELEEISVVAGGNGPSHIPSTTSRDPLAGSHDDADVDTDSAGMDLDDASCSETLPDPGNGSIQANGPRALPAALPTGPPSVTSDRTRLIGQRLAGSCGRINVASPVYTPASATASPGSGAAGGGRSVEPVAPRSRNRSTSRASLFEVMQNRIEQVKQGNSKKVRDLSHASMVNKAYNPEPMTPKEIRKQRRKEINEKFGKKQQALQFAALETSTSGSSDKDGCRWTFVFDPSGRLAYWWSAVVSIAFLYNFWVIIYRFAFDEINTEKMAVWFTLDYLADLLYVLDIAFHFRTGYLEDGVLQTDSVRLRIHYMNSTMFYIDGLCLLPLDFLYLSIGFNSMLRCFRLIKIYRFWAFLDRTERHTNYPNVVRTITLLHYLFCIYHWNACIMYIITRRLDNDAWLFPTPGDGGADVFTQYLHALHWSTLTLTTIGELPRPETKGEYIFVIFEFVMALLLFSSVLGHVANIVTSISSARKTFQANLDSVKTYMMLRRVPLRLQDRVIKWFDYLWLSKKSSNEDQTLMLLPDKLKAEIALHVHLDTLKRVEIFQNTEAGFLCELVLKLRPVLFSPGDYICRKGEIGKEMYIVSRGKLQVVADNGKTILATLRPGSYFGEISILNMGNAGNRRTASVRSVGYSDLFVLSKKDLWDVLLDYPTARVRLEAIAMKRLEKYKKAPLDEEAEEVKKAAIPRSKSTPGLVESSGKVPLETMFVARHNTLPAGVGGSRQPSVAGSRQPSVEGSSVAGSSSRGGGRDSGSSRSSRGGGRPPDPLTNSMTVSSITSYQTDDAASAQKSPLLLPCTADLTTPSSTSAPSPRFASSSLTSSTSPYPLPQPVIVAPSAFRPIESLQHHHHHHHGAGANLTSPSTVAAVTAAGYNDPALLHQRLLQTSLAPATSYPAGYQTHPPPGGSGSGSTGRLMAPTGPSPGAGLHPCHSMGSMTSLGHSHQPMDPSHDILLQEITRLRSRLQTLETENASMSFKLNQQQWEVEHRLSEIEMHICGSDSLDSESTAGQHDRGSVQGNKESVI